jgi:hypothetical protein
MGGADHPMDAVDRLARKSVYDPMEELAMLVEWADAWLDENVSQPYKDQPLAQDWARVAKIGEEGGEAIDALIGMTGQNPRKGRYASEEELLAELADTALTAIYATQHFTKDIRRTIRSIQERARYHRRRIEGGEINPDDPVWTPSR